MRAETFIINFEQNCRQIIQLLIFLCFYSFYKINKNINVRKLDLANVSGLDKINVVFIFEVNGVSAVVKQLL